MRGLWDEAPAKVRCIDCEFLAGSDRTPQWLFASGRGYCDHPDRAGGRWNCLQGVDGFHGCERFKQADKDRVKLRIHALDVLRRRKKDAVRN